MDRIAQLKKFLDDSPADDFVTHALALEYIKLDNAREARRLFELILQRNPGYIGSYYHLAKLLQEMQEPSLAKEWYDKGMLAARQAGDQHSYQELAAALDEMND